MPAICVMALIFYFSSQTALESSDLSGGITRNFVEGTLNISKIELSAEERLVWIENMEGFVRKAAHVAEYGVLGLAVAYPLYAYGKRKRKMILWGEFICILYAVTDELHQLYVPGRAGRISDVVIDGIGALIGCLLFYFLTNFLQVHKKFVSVPGTRGGTKGRKGRRTER